MLAELLSADLPSAEPGLPLPGTAPRAKPERGPQPPREPKSRGLVQVQAVPETCEVEIVTFQEHRGWRPRFVNGAELSDWLARPMIHDYVNNRATDGWELTAATSASRFYGSSDGIQLYFRRRRRE